MAQGIDLRHRSASRARIGVSTIRAIGTGSSKPTILNLLKIAPSRILMKSNKSIIKTQSLCYGLIAKSRPKDFAVD